MDQTFCYPHAAPDTFFLLLRGAPPASRRVSGLAGKTSPCSELEWYPACPDAHSPPCWYRRLSLARRRGRLSRLWRSQGACSRQSPRSPCCFETGPHSAETRKTAKGRERPMVVKKKSKHPCLNANHTGQLCRSYGKNNDDPKAQAQ